MGFFSTLRSLVCCTGNNAVAPEPQPKPKDGKFGTGYVYKVVYTTEGEQKKILVRQSQDVVTIPKATKRYVLEHHAVATPKLNYNASGHFHRTHFTGVDSTNI